MNLQRDIRTRGRRGAFTVFKYKGNYHPADSGYGGPTKAFINGHGYVKIPKKTEEAPALASNRAADIKAFCDRWGIYCTRYALGASNTNDCVNFRIIHEIDAAARYGEAYDLLLDKWEALNVEWLNAICDTNNVIIDATHDIVYDGEGKRLFYLNGTISLLSFLDHSIMGYISVRPSFDPIDFEGSLDKFILDVKYADMNYMSPEYEALRIKMSNQSVYEKVAELANQGIAEKISNLMAEKLIEEKTI